MTKKNLKPQQAAPVQRENNATVALLNDGNAIVPAGYGVFGAVVVPFAGDDAE